MNKALQTMTALALMVLVLISGCTQQQSVQSTAPTNTDNSFVPSGPGPNTQTPVNSGANTPDYQPNPPSEAPPAVETPPATEPATPTETIPPEPSTPPVPPAAIQPTVKEFTVIADEQHFDPATITVSKGDTVRITFSFNDEDIYHGGLDIKSPYFTVSYRKDGSTKTVEFVAEKSFTYTGYWPATGVRKASGQVEVSN
ncbi:MAG: hypothetical protein HY917_04855 [Candidatus Diapherotrites archaeon]|nr:hypothetical protein [Candidatus Diapherotrites archaeon]